MQDTGGDADTAYPGSFLTDVDAVDLPRVQAGYPPQHLLLTLLGDYGLDVGDPIPSAALVAILGEFGVTAAGARAAIGRLARRNLLNTSRRGRTTAYAMTERCADLVAEGRRLTQSFTGTLADWDGRWTLVSYSITEEHRTQRTLLRARLRWLGFGPLQDGVWISPRPGDDTLDAVLLDIGPSACAVFRGDLLHGVGRLNPLAAWDLDALRQAYTAFIDEFTPVIVGAAALSPSEALVARMRMTYQWFALANEHAELPAELLPASWPAVAARGLFDRVGDVLGSRAAQCIADHVGRWSPELAGRVRLTP